MNLLFKPVEKVIDILVEVSIRQVGYVINFRGNVEELKKCVRDLEKERKTVKRQVDDDERNLREIKATVDGWLEDADAKISEGKSFLEDEDHKKTGCSRGLLPYLWYRHRLGRTAKKMAVEVGKSLEGAKFEGGVSHPLNPLHRDEKTLSDAEDEEQLASRRDTMKKIMEKLEDPTVRIIGVHGPSGVGKTTLVNAIARKARHKKLFNVVVPPVDITDNPNPQKIQEDIAYWLQLGFDGAGETGRADRLRRRLKQEKENTLIILDDLWNALDLNKLGIPFDDDDDEEDLSQVTVKVEKDFKTKEGKGETDIGYKMVKKEKYPGEYNGCKILLASRFEEVLSDKMNVQKDSIIPVTKLDDEEAVTLFRKVAEIQDENSNFMPEIVKYCAGLPMVIVQFGKALRNTSDSEWKVAVERLKKKELTGVHKWMEFSVKEVYDHLESEELKSIFLLCARMGHQPLIMDLVKYCFGLGILEGVNTLREARDKIYESIQKLEDSSLLLGGNSTYHFHVHDMVRDAALSIARKEQNVFTFRNGKLNDWPNKDELERCTAICIHNCDIIDELPKVINCPQLKVLHIDTDDPSLKIPETFFKRMQKLRVLILTGFHLSCLPSSIKYLLNLRMLCLERCILCGDLSIIGELKKLRILSFSGSEIENLPAELEFLRKLQLLDISNCSIDKVISPDFISSLTSLEELYMRNYLIKKDVEAQANQSLITILAKLRYLHQLTFLDICIPSAEILPTSLLFNKLTDYKIVVGDFKILSFGDFKMPNKYEALRSLALQLKDSTDIHSQKGIKMLFKTVENLLLGEINGVQNAFYELNLNVFPDLKHLSIINNQDIEYIINSMELSHFPNLESLSLYQLRNIKVICCSPVTSTSFNKLKTIKVKMCNQLKNLFSFYLVQFLTSLDTIDVSECDSLEEIVIEESQPNTKTVDLQKLRSITLEWLPSFTSFYTSGKMLSAPQLIEGQATNSDEITIADDEHTDMASLSLFGELVEIPNLESLKLSSINIHNIWSDKRPSGFYFQNLIKLTVKACHNLRYLCSLSVASCLNKLRGLFVSDCRMMEKIFITEGNNDSKVCIFPKLVEIQLIDMNMLRDMWPVKVGAKSFSSLVSVHIVRCIKLDKVFPSRMAKRLQSLDSLTVIGCKSVEVIFELKDSWEIHAFRIDTKLRLIYLKYLPRLKQVWNRDPGGILNFKNLRSIEVISCYELHNILPASVVRDLEKLEHFMVNYCNQMEEIVAWEEGLENSNEPIVFPEVTYMGFLCLPKIKRFYNGRHTIQCPKLKRLAMRDCDYLETFAIEATNEERKAVFSAEEVISKLEYMEIGLNEVMWLRSNVGNYRMHGLKELCLRDLASVEILYWLLHRIPNLERLNLNSIGSGIKELVPSGNIAPQERLGTISQLKELTLNLSFYMEDIGFERDPVLQTVERLVLRDCDKFIKLAHSSVSFTHLTYLDVNSCGRLINLMASSTAKSLVQLTTMKVINCEAMKVIVTDEGNEQETVVDVVFSKLTTLELVRLKNLTSFCSFENCIFKFPSLEKLILRDCPRMKTFTESDTTSPKLQNILAGEGEEGEKWYWQDDLNSTIRKAFTDKVSFQFTQHLELSRYYPELERVWHGNDLVQESSFRNLKTLVVDKCENLVHVIPSHLLPCFKNLEQLQVKRCSAVQVIFNINDLRVTKALRSLKRLSLIELPKLEHVWDKEPEGILDLQVLQDVNVDGCMSLKNLFSASAAKDLAKLENLRVTMCKELVEIFAKDENATEGTTREFAFHCLRSLELSKLPGLKYFYPGLRKLEWPVMEVLHVDWAILENQEAHPEKQVVCISIEKVIPSLKKLSLSIGDTMITWDQVSRKMECRKLQQFEQESDSVVYRFLQMIPNIEKLQVRLSSLKEMFSAERPNADYTGVLSHLKELKLWFLDNLKSIGLEHSWLHPIPENLRTLEVERCGSLINLVPCTCTVSFSNLTYLAISRCNGLIYLLTCSTTKSLGRLKRMKINACRSMQEIVCKEGDESSQDQDENIIFGQLQDLYLDDLPKLRWFYPGNYTISFPSLEQVYVIKCQRMKTFCAVSIINPPKLSSGVFIKDEDEDAAPRWRWEGDLNTTIRKTYEEKKWHVTSSK